MKRLFGGARESGIAKPDTSLLLDGAYRPHRQEDLARFKALAEEAFPQFSDRIDPFASDWLGRQFALDHGRLVGGEPQVLLLELGSGQAFEIPMGYERFHQQELIQHPVEAVEYGLFKEWLGSGNRAPEYGRCIMYKTPLLLGGQHAMANLEEGDFEVYWGLCAQLLERVRNLPQGTSIASVTIK
jgi:hypothetical protein